MMKNWSYIPFISAFALLGLTSCEDDGLVPGNDVSDRRNVEAWTFSYWGTDPFHTDSVYEVTDAFIKIESLELVFSDYEFALSNLDTVDEETSYAVANMSVVKHKVGLLPNGNYNGQHLLKVGYDSASFNMPEASIPESLRRTQWIRSDGGLNHFVMKGLYLPLSDTVATEPYLPFEYHLGGEDFNLQFEKNMSFGVTTNNPVTLLFTFQVNRLFDGGLTPVERQFIFADPLDNEDYDAAVLLHGNLSAGLTLD